jgi:hypothetical protein
VARIYLTALCFVAKDPIQLSLLPINRGRLERN